MTNYMGVIIFEPWYSIDENEELFSKELYNEVGKQHPLFEVHVKAVTKRQDCDDVLFELDNFNNRYAVVHLTWSQKRETGNYPRIAFKVIGQVNKWLKSDEVLEDTYMLAYG